MSNHKLNIAIASNTSNPCLLVLRSKGFQLRFRMTTDHAGNKWEEWTAENAKGHFSANSPEELLGLIAMWEARGNNWQTAENEPFVIEQAIQTMETCSEEFITIDFGDE